MYAHETPFHDRLRECFAIIDARETATPQRCADGTVVVGYTVPMVATTSTNDTALYAEFALKHPITSVDAEAYTTTCTMLRCNVVHTPTQTIMRQVHVPLDDDEALPISVTPEQLVAVVNRSLRGAIPLHN